MLAEKLIEEEKISEEVEKTEVKDKSKNVKKTVNSINVDEKNDSEVKSKSTKREVEESKEQIDEASVIEKIKSFIFKNTLAQINYLKI